MVFCTNFHIGIFFTNFAANIQQYVSTSNYFWIVDGHPFGGPRRFDWFAQAYRFRLGVFAFRGLFALDWLDRDAMH